MRKRTEMTGRRLWRLARTGIAALTGRQHSHKAPVSRSIFWSDNPYDWGIIPLSYYIPNIKSFYERKSMIDKQERELIMQKIKDFFDKLNVDHGATVESVSLEWQEHLIMGQHDEYFLMSCDVGMKL